MSPKETHGKGVPGEAGNRADKAFSEHLFQTILETVRTAMVILEEDMTISLVNTAFEELTGYSRQETEGKKTWKEFVEKDRQEEMTAYHHARRVDPHSAPERYEFRIIDRAGARRNVLAAVAMIPGTKRGVVSLR